MPEGATGKNSDGVWLKEVDYGGRSTIFEWYDELEMWVEPRVLAGREIYTFAEGENYRGLPNIGPIRVFFAEDPELQASPYFFAHSGKGMYRTFEDKLKSWYGIVENKLALREYGTDRDEAMAQDLYRRLGGGIFSMSVVTPEGTFDAKLNRDFGCDMIVIPYEDADPAEDPRFIEWVYGPDYLNGRSMTLVRNGRLITVVGSKTPIDMLTEDQVRAIVLFAYARVILAEDQSLEFYINRRLPLSKIQDIINFAGRGPNFDERYPVIDVVTRP